MAVYSLVDFSDILNAVREELKIQSSDTVTLNRIRRDINMVYLQEVLPYARWKWLEEFTTVQLPAVYTSNTVSVLPDSDTVTFNTAPLLALGSFVNYKFSVSNQAELYTVVAHTAGSDTMTIDRPYNGPQANTTAQYQIWRDYLALPANCRETIELWHDFDRTPMEGRGMQEFRKIQQASPKMAGRPYFYYTGEFEDPTPGDAETDATRYRKLFIHPAINVQRTNLHVIYTKEVEPLELDGDEPIIPLEDRIVLLYGALAKAWRRERNEEAAANNFQLYQNKLARMAGKVEDTLDKPSFNPESMYISSKRGPRLGYRGARVSGGGGGGGGGFIDIKFVSDITIAGGNFTANMTANPGVTIDGRDISVDGAALDAHIAASQEVHGIGAGSSVVGTNTVQTLTSKNYRTGLQDVVLVTSNDVNGDISAQPDLLASTNLPFLKDAEGLLSVTLTDATTDQVVDSWSAASFNSLHIMYSLERGSGNVETGLLTIASDGTSVAIAAGAAASLGTLGVTLDADIDSGNVRLLSTTTSTGTDATIKYKLLKWLND